MASILTNGHADDRKYGKFLHLRQFKTNMAKPE